MYFGGASADGNAGLSVEILYRTDDWRRADLNTDFVVRAARAAFAAAEPDAKVAFELAVLLTGDAESRTLNGKWRGKDTPTNVLSFPNDAPHAMGEEARPLGDLALAYETVAREAADADRSLDQHTVHLIVHGVLHLLGFDHQTPSEADAMEAEERRILARLGVPDPYVTSPAEERTNADLKTAP